MITVVVSPYILSFLSAKMEYIWGAGLADDTPIVKKRDHLASVMCQHQLM